MLCVRRIGDFGKCREQVRPLLNQTVCARAPCSLNGMHQPPIDFSNSDFFGFSEFYYSMEDVLRMAGKYEYASFAQAAQVSHRRVVLVFSRAISRQTLFSDIKL